MRGVTTSRRSFEHVAAGGAVLRTLAVRASVAAVVAPLVTKERLGASFMPVEVEAVFAPLVIDSPWGDRPSLAIDLGPGVGHDA